MEKYESVPGIQPIQAGQGSVPQADPGSAYAQPSSSSPAPKAPAAPSPAPNKPAPAPGLPKRDSVEISVAAQVAAVEAFRTQVSSALPGGANTAPDALPKQEGGNVSIRYNGDIGVLQAKVVDPVTNEVIREIPPDAALQAAVRIRSYFRDRLTRPRVQPPVRETRGEKAGSAGEE